MHAPRYFEDFQVGEVLGSQRKTMTESEIVDFAWKYDPQPFHVSRPDAEASMFGGLIASGFQTIAVTFRLIWQANAYQQTGSGAGSIDQVRWLKPVRPGDTLRATLEIVEKRESRSMPDLGIIRCRYTTYNQDEEVVMTMEAPQLAKKRRAAG